ncbi:DUF1800 domain-containing protein [Dyadobacter chenhuakuii]|uniref:DUF1800 domain-containing protein n=1 Tax=Dyadobacter chenhuakuii TaxID=2909339 RepID=A0A9X1TUN7_9BACT|nr:DUF1800 family protein [Dyadobacter chenhuakuii]MCF2501519.1 DUF1800 domain-containing protein [Dyadobacter chenhuakuii]
MSYLDVYSEQLTASTAAHLLRRVTFGPTNSEIAEFTGLTATEAVDKLISNSTYAASPPPPVEMDETRPNAGQQFLSNPYDATRTYDYSMYIKYWWIGLMCKQDGKPSVLEKLTAFWQNHFVVAHSSVGDYRLVNRYIRFLRANALGNFRTLAVGITKDPGMLIFQNGSENTKAHPNENYGRELQELFTVGQKDFQGNDNYTEQDVKAAARVLSGWQVPNYKKAGSVSTDPAFNLTRHDTSDKVFSSKYNDTVIRGRNDNTAGDTEVNELIDMLLRHPEMPKHICRKLYRWYVNPNVTPEIESQVIVPLATFFASSQNDFAITPVLRKLLTSQIFFATNNIGAILKSPAEFMIGTLRMINQPIPNITTEYAAFFKVMNYLYWNMTTMQLSFLDQPLVFGSVPYYQTGFSKNWINGTTLGLRGQHSDGFVVPWMEIKPGQMLGINFIQRLTALQPNFSDVTGTPPISIDVVFKDFSKNLFAIELSQSQQNFLIDTIMMRGIPRTSWDREWNAYRTTPTDSSKRNTVVSRCQWLVKHMFRMAEYQVF